LRIGALRAKAQRARDLANFSGNQQAVVNLESYARELEAEAQALEAELDATFNAGPPPSENRKTGLDAEAARSGPCVTSQDNTLDTADGPTGPERPDRQQS
jgi:hypothetical protein